MQQQPLKILKINYLWFITGIFLLILGFTLLSWDPDSNNWDENLYPWQKVSLSPVLLLAGYFFTGFAIMKSRKE